jgi:hypothetical protein
VVIVAAVCALLVVLTTIIHYEALRTLSSVLPTLRVAARAKVLVAMFVAFFAHAVEIVLYAIAVHALVRFAHLGTLGEPERFSFATCLYFSAETYTSLGYGDVIPLGEMRMVAGIEALNGLLLIGWSASYTYIAMERFWSAGKAT